jgi:hypothetical protein
VGIAVLLSVGVLAKAFDKACCLANLKKLTAIQRWWVWMSPVTSLSLVRRISTLGDNDGTYYTLTIDTVVLVLKQVKMMRDGAISHAEY